MQITKNMAVGCSQGRLAGTCIEAYCTICSQVLYRIPAGSSYFIELWPHAKCDCDWKCCCFSEHGAQKHEQHIAHRRSEVEVTEFVRCI
jgi:hypothetical protein